jgi:predicted phosphodiesterase
MKLLIYSDLHLEFSPFNPAPEVVDAADVIVLAGDIGKGMRGTRSAQEWFDNKSVIYVAGNHEFYGHDRKIAIDNMRADCAGTNVHFLDRDEITLDGVRFLGATLWTDFDLLAKGRIVERRVALTDARRGLNDFRLIEEGNAKDNHRRFTPEDSIREHKLSRAWLAQQLSVPHDGPTVVVTHHAPSGRSGAMQYQGDALSPCFASALPLDEFFGKAALWIHGHMHNTSDYQHAGTRVVCNPRGYPRSRHMGSVGGYENEDFDPAKIIEV